MLLDTSQLCKLQKQRGWSVVFPPDIWKLAPEAIRSLRAVLIMELSGSPTTYSRKVQEAARNSCPLPLIVSVSDEDLFEAAGLEGDRNPFISFLLAISLFGNAGENLYCILIHGHVLEMALLRVGSCPLRVVRKALEQGAKAAAEWSAQKGGVEVKLEPIKAAEPSIRAFAKQYAELVGSTTWEKEEVQGELIRNYFSSIPFGRWLPVLAPVVWDPILDLKGYPAGLGDAFTARAGAIIGEAIAKAMGWLPEEWGRSRGLSLKRRCSR